MTEPSDDFDETKATPTTDPTPTGTFGPAPTDTFDTTPTGTFDTTPTATFDAAPTGTFGPVPTATFDTTPAAMSGAAPAGWYPAPTMPAHHRFWTGYAWSGSVFPSGPSSPQWAPSIQSPAGPVAKPA